MARAFRRLKQLGAALAMGRWDSNSYSRSPRSCLGTDRGVLLRQGRGHWISKTLAQIGRYKDKRLLNYG